MCSIESSSSRSAGRLMIFRETVRFGFSSLRSANSAALLRSAKTRRLIRSFCAVIMA